MNLNLGAHVSIARRFLRPKTAAAPLTSDPRDLVRDLIYCGTGPRQVGGQTKEAHLVRHKDISELLFSLKPPKPEAGPASPAAVAAAAADVAAAGGAAAAAEAPATVVLLPNDEEEEIEDSADEMDLDLDDEHDILVVPPGAPQLEPAGADQVVYDPWAHTPVDLADDRASHNARLHNISGLSEGFMSPTALFINMINPTTVDRILRATNKQNISPKLERDEFFCWLGLLFAASSFTGARQDLWTPAKHKYAPKPPLADAMSRRRFDAIASALRLTDTPRPAFADRFHAVRELIDDFNAHMKRIFWPSDTVCLDESMVTFNNAASPGNMYVARKPNPVGNEYHTICDAQCGIMFAMELVEGSSRPPELGKPKYEEEYQSKTTGLLLRMTESIAGKGIVVVMDSAFCVMKALMALKARGIYAASVAKKRSYWPRHIPGDEILAHMQGKPVGELHGRRGKLGNTRFNIFAVNHVRYTFIMVATYGSTLLQGEEKKIKTADGQTFSYKRNEPISDYYKARHAVDDHNRHRQGQRIGIEKAWGSKFWANRQLAFIITVNLVNSMLAYNHYIAAKHGKPQLSLNDFKDSISIDLIRLWEERELEGQAASKRPRRSSDMEHTPVKMQKFEGAKPGVPTAKPYQQVVCRGVGCKSLTRQYCSCDRTLFLCSRCMVSHLADVFSHG